jgi:hypothetical protein
MNQIQLTESQAKQFKEWVENTQLFSVIKEESHTFRGVNTRIQANDGTLALSLEPGVVIEKAEDLPKELLIQFYINSPFYNSNHIENLLDET